MKIIFIPYLVLLSFLSLGQGQFNNWYCGYGAGMTFNTSPPSIITPNPMYTDDNSATISDANGNLLFFANGTTAYDRNGNAMPNGSGLLGNSTAGQTATIVQQPGNNKYYLFTMDAMGGANGATYSVVDMTLNGGLGDIVSTQKNVTILAPATEKIAPIRHGNGTDVWILLHQWNSNSFNAYLLTASGLSTTPIITNIGTTVSGGFSPGYNAMGQLTVNKANTMVAEAVYSDGNIQVFDFDNSTGVLSNTVMVSLYRAFGLEFSPNGNFLYATVWYQSDIYQYSLSTYTATAINSSQVDLGSCNGQGYIQTGPDGKLYVAKYQNNYFGVINNPNNSGTACNFVDQGFNTGTYQSSAGLVDKILVNPACSLHVNLGNDTTLCNVSSFILTDTNTNASHLWSNGDTSSSIAVTDSGTYWVRVTEGNCTASDTIHVTFATTPQPFDLGNDTTYCGSFSRVLSTGISTTVWSTGATASQITVSAPGRYWATITNACGTASDTITISENPLPVVNLGNDTNVCNSNPITLNATTTGATYSWQNGTTNPTLTVSSSGIYWVNVTVGGCTDRDSITVAYINPNSFNIGADTTYCGSFDRTLTAGVAHTIWSNGDTATSISVDSPGVYWAYAVACGDTFRDSITIFDKPSPVVNLGNDTSICPSDSVILNAANPGATYLWDNYTTRQTLTVNTAATYWVNVTINGCTKRDSILITDLFLPLAFNIGNDTTICDDSILILSAYQTGVAYYWSTGDTTSVIAVTQSGQYHVIDSNSCGSYTASVNVMTKQCICKIAIPTAFSPNNDGKNDSFYVLTQCPLDNFQFDIYNRWGQEIFSSDNINDKWDGSYRGKQLPLGVYVYFLHYKDPYTKKDNSQTGNVTLLR
jgi:gliding motility-associated-like protein